MLFSALLFGFFTFTNLSAAREMPAPDFKLEDLSGTTVELKSFKGKRPVLLFFWTTWCPYCQRELKVLNTRLENLEKTGVELIAIDVGEPASRVNRVVKNYNLAFKVFLDEDSSVANSYGILGVPTFVLVDKKGYISFVDNYFPDEEIKRLSPE